MTEYEANKANIKEYRKRGGKIIHILCKIMEWFNEHCIKDMEED